MFNANPALKIAFLSHNEVDAIEDSLLQNKPELKRVDLGDNQFESVGDIFEVKKIYIDFDQNIHVHFPYTILSSMISFQLISYKSESPDAAVVVLLTAESSSDEETSPSY